MEEDSRTTLVKEVGRELRHEILLHSFGVTEV